MSRDFVSAFALCSVLAFAAATAFSQEVVVKRHGLVRGGGPKWDHRLVAVDSGLVIAWGESANGDTFMQARMKRVSMQLESIGDAVLLAQLNGGSQNLITDTVWTDEGLIMLTARNSNGASVREISFDRGGGDVLIRDLASFDFGNSLSRLIKTPTGYLAARYEVADRDVDLIALDNAGSLLFVRFLGELPAGNVGLLPADSGALLLHQQEKTSRIVNAKLGLELPKLRTLTKKGGAMLFRGPDGYLMLYIRGSKLYSIKLDSDAKRAGKRHVVSREPILFDGMGYKWDTADAVYDGSGYGCVLLEKGEKEKVVFRQFDADGRSKGVRIVLVRGKNPSEPRIILADGHYFVSWMEGPTKRRIYAARIKPLKQKSTSR